MSNYTTPPNEVPPAPVTKAPDADEVAQLLASTPDRFADKADVPDDDDEPAVAEQMIRPPKDPNVEWRNVPYVPEQMVRFPHTVRPGVRVDAVFNLSQAGDLAEFNRIQAEASNHVDGLTSVIHSIDKQFHEGQFFALVTYSKLFYQKM